MSKIFCIQCGLPAPFEILAKAPYLCADCKIKSNQANLPIITTKPIPDCSLPIVHDLCDWPGCIAPAYCCTGNAGGAFVCAMHFQIINGTKEAPDLMAILSMTRIAQLRRELSVA